MEFDGSGQEGGGHFLVKLKSHIDNPLSVPLNLGGEPALTDVAREDVLVDGPQGLLARETDGKHTGGRVARIIEM